MMVKVRNGFVSNSSSSSFVIAILDAGPQPCPTCGRKDLALLDVINERGYYDDTEVEWEGIEEGIKGIQAEIDEHKRNIDDYKQMKPDKQVYPDSSFNYTYAQAIVSYKKDIEVAKALIEEYKEWAKEYKRIIGLSVSYHDDTVNDMISSNNIKILSGE